MPLFCVHVGKELSRRKGVADPLGVTVPAEPDQAGQPPGEGMSALPSVLHTK